MQSTRRHSPSVNALGHVNAALKSVTDGLREGVAHVILPFIPMHELMHHQRASNEHEANGQIITRWFRWSPKAQLHLISTTRSPRMHVHISLSPSFRTPQRLIRVDVQKRYERLGDESRYLGVAVNPTIVDPTMLCHVICVH